jgi:hypothetical protein
MLVHVLLPPDSAGNRVESDVEDDRLVKLDGVVDDDNEHTTWVEYRFPGSDIIVHRSAHVTIKEWPAGCEALAGQFA